MIWASAKLEAQYNFKSTIDLKKYNEKFVEMTNSRSVVGDLNITLNHTNSKSESYNVKIKTSDIQMMTPFSINIKKNSLLIGSAEALLLKKNHSRTELAKAFGSEIKRELIQILTKIDSNILTANNEISIKNINFSCKSINTSNKECHLGGQVSLISKSLIEKDDDLSVLVKHLTDVKTEMSKSGSDYDIGGYREFLDKCESLVKNALNSLHTDKKNSKVQALVEVRRMIVNERVDSYEYTAIRAKSIVGFVDTIIKLI